MSGSVGGSEPVQAGPPAPEEAPQSTLPSGGASGVVHGGQLDTTEATIEGSIGPKDKRADCSGGSKKANPQSEPIAKPADPDAPLDRDVAVALEAVGKRQPDVVIDWHHGYPLGTVKGAICRFTPAGLEVYLPSDAADTNTGQTAAK